MMKEDDLKSLEDSIEIRKEYVKKLKIKRKMDIFNHILILILIIVWITTVAVFEFLIITDGDNIVCETGNYTESGSVNEYSSLVVECNTVEVVESSEENYAEEYIIDYFACCVMAEAEDQCELGKRLVIDVILNRIDSDDFPNNIQSVIDQSGAFSCVSDNRINSVNTTDEIYILIEEEMENRTNSEVLYFKTNGYHSFGTPVIQVGDHYFSK